MLHELLPSLFDSTTTVPAGEVLDVSRRQRLKENHSGGEDGQKEEPEEETVHHFRHATPVLGVLLLQLTSTLLQLLL